MHIKSATYLISSPDYKKCPPPDKPEYAFIGRSNVGKSSLINMLCDNSKLAKTSGSPGKTQLINHFIIESSLPPAPSGGRGEKRVAEKSTDGKKNAAGYSPSTGGGRGEAWYLVDLPGYGYAKVSQSSRRRWEQMIEGYLRHRPNLANVFVLIDSRHGPQKIDLAFLEQLGKWEVPFCLVFTKADKETQKTVSRNVKDFLNAMRQTWQFLPPHFVTSAVKKQGREKILDFIGKANDDINSLGH